MNKKLFIFDPDKIGGENVRNSDIIGEAVIKLDIEAQSPPTG